MKQPTEHSHVGCCYSLAWALTLNISRQQTSHPTVTGNCHHVITATIRCQCKTSQRLYMGAEER